MYENVTFEFYTKVLKRNIIPDEATFDTLVPLNIAFFEARARRFTVTELVEDGIDSAICMMCEVDYSVNRALTGKENSGRISSLTVGSVSKSYDKSFANSVIDANVKSAEEQKMDYLYLYCHIYLGV